ncbi:hypothetical protein AB0K15_13880 [Amycolatopsis sp. NPDC049253]|uniref:hypothetical protein n=1 Tax=Amycolatopsis sp. NPDC049253 TaxID=3155274 RepID=UPI003435A064
MRKRRRTVWTSEEARKFLESARDARDPMYAGYVLAVVLGPRKGEIMGLTRGALDFGNGELAISHQLRRAGGELLYRDTKTAASDDTLPLPSIVVAALEKRRREQRADQRVLSRPGTRTTWYSPRSTGCRSTPGASTGPGTTGSRAAGSGRSPFTMAGGPEARCWSTWTCTLG